MRLVAICFPRKQFLRWNLVCRECFDDPTFGKERKEEGLGKTIGSVAV
jgi:hypothetical protein